MAAIRRSLARFAVGAILIIGFSAGWFLSARAGESTAVATANIIAPIAISNKADLAFALIVPHAGSRGTMMVSPDGNIGCGPNLSCTGTAEPSGFFITGEPLKTFTITLPSGSQTITASANSMIVDNFTSNLATPGVLSSDGKATIFVGATLHVGANQPLDTYRSTFMISVEYE